MGTASTQIPEKGTTILVSQENSIFEPLQGYEEIHIQEGFIGVTTCLTHSGVLCINEDKIVEESEYATVQMKWDVLHKVIEYKGNIYLLLSKNKGIIIQKNDISEELRAFIKGRIDNL